MSASSAFAVSIKIGICAVSCCERISSQQVKPSFTGIITSEIIKSGSFSFAMCTPSSPLPASYTVYLEINKLRMYSRTSSLSSMINRLFFAATFCISFSEVCRNNSVFKPLDCSTSSRWQSTHSQVSFKKCSFPSGIYNTNVLPSPGTLSNVTRPWCKSIVFFTICSPIPIFVETSGIFSPVMNDSKTCFCSSFDIPTPVSETAIWQ